MKAVSSGTQAFRYPPLSRHLLRALRDILFRHLDGQKCLAAHREGEKMKI